CVPFPAGAPPPSPSADEARACRAVRPVMLRVAVLTLAIDGVDRFRIARIARMPRQVGVTLLAQARPRYLQQEVILAAVRIGAIQTVLADWRMVPQERAALLRMAFVAVVVDSGLFEQRLPVTAVRIVAVAACHLAFAQRHVRRAPDLGPLVLVTLEA